MYPGTNRARKPRYTKAADPRGARRRSPSDTGLALLLDHLLVVGGDLSKDITCLNDVKLVTLGGERVFEDGIRYVGTHNMFM